MTADKLAEYKQAQASVPETNHMMPLYGVGLENLGKDKQPIEVVMPAYGPDQLLVRHDANGICFSDIKVIKQGENHPRIYRKSLKDEPIVLGHEVTMTVVGVGENLRDQYSIGDRFIVQADIHSGGVGYAYGYEIQGGLSEYGVIDQRVLNGDDGNYLVRVQPETGYAESALTEPWACVIAAYQLEYRTGLKAGGVTWIVGTPASDMSGYSISAGFDAASHPAKLLLSNVPAEFATWLKSTAAELGVDVHEVSDVSAPPVDKIDDIVILGADPDVIETVSPFLADFGIAAVIASQPAARKIKIDIGRVHYNRWVYVGGTTPDIAAAYNVVPVRSTLKPGGLAWFVGAGGPMGRMHVQRAIQIANGPKTMLCSDVSDVRLNDLRDSFAAEAAEKGIEFICVNPMNKDDFEAAFARFRESGFDDIMVLAPVPAVIADSAQYLAPKGVMNVFAGVGRGTMVDINISDVYLKDARHIGHSASTIDDLKLMLHQTEAGELSTNRSVAAVGSLNAAWDGIKAVEDTVFPGKVVIYPHIKDLPLTPISDLKEKMPTVYAKLKDGHEWTNEAEAEFLRLMLK